MKFKKGFTLVELVVVLAISFIIILLVSSLSILVSNYTKANQITNDMFKELKLFSNNVNSVVEEYEDASYTWTVNGENITFTSVENTFVLFFEDGALKLSSETIQQCEFITSVSFEMQNTIVKCIANYGDNQKYVVIINKRI